MIVNWLHDPCQVDLLPLGQWIADSKGRQACLFGIDRRWAVIDPETGTLVARWSTDELRFPLEVLDEREPCEHPAGRERRQCLTCGAQLARQ